MPAENKPSSVENADVNIFTFAPFFSNVFSVVMVSLFVIGLGVMFPWGGGPASPGAVLFFSLAVASSLYSLLRGYSQIYKRGIKGFRLFVWFIAILVTLALTVEVVLIGSSLIHAAVVFPGSKAMLSPNIFFFTASFQALYFLIESIVVSFASLYATSKNQYMGYWYLAIYLFIISLNSAAIVAGLLILGYPRAL